MPSIIFVHAGCIAVHDEFEFVYGQGLVDMYSGYASKYAVRVGYMPCVYLLMPAVKLYEFGVRMFIHVTRLSILICM